MLTDIYSFIKNSICQASYKEKHKFQVKYNLESGISIKLLDISGQPSFQGSGQTPIYYVDNNLTQRVQITSSAGWTGNVDYGGMNSVAQDSSNNNIIIAKCASNEYSHLLTLTLEKQEAPSGFKAIPITQSATSGTTYSIQWYSPSATSVTLGADFGGVSTSLNANISANVGYTTKMRLDYTKSGSNMSVQHFYIDGTDQWGLPGASFSGNTTPKVFIKAASTKTLSTEQTSGVIVKDGNLEFETPIIKLDENNYRINISRLLIGSPIEI